MPPTSSRRPPSCWICTRATGKGSDRPVRPDHQLRREDQHPGPHPLSSDPGAGPGRRRRVEAEYERGGALQYLAAWDVQQGRVMGRCEAKTGIEPFGRLVNR